MSPGLRPVTEWASVDVMSDQPRRVAIVGAGMAGLACAWRLHAAGAVVTVFDKGRQPGGRLATRRSGNLQFDHGAQYATARSPQFLAMLQAAGPLAAIWTERPHDPWWVGVPGMSALAQALVSGGAGQVRPMRHVAFLHREPDGWRVRHRDAAATAPGLVAAEGGEVAGPFDAVVLAVPAPQAAGLLGAIEHPFASRIAAVRMAPCWALMLAFDDPQSGPDIQASEGPLAWIARDSSRPGRRKQPECWVGHASPAWSRAHLERSPEDVLPLLQDAFAAATGIAAAPSVAAVHRWRYARVEAALGQPCLAGPDGLAVCGDWCLGPRVEAAFEAGLAAAEAVA